MTGSELRELRMKHGLTQVELADLIGVKQPSISTWETGETPIRTSVERLIRLALKEEE